MKVKEESGKVGLKLNIQKTKIMASGPISSWQIDGETMETKRLCFLGLQNHYRWCLHPWNLKMLAPWKKSYDQPRQHIKKKRHYFANKGPSSQSFSFFSKHAWLWELYHKEGWTPEKWCFWTVVLEKTFESPLDCKESILKKISLECSLEELMLKLKLQYIGHLMRRPDSFGKTLILWKTEDKRRRGGQRMR